MAEYLLRQDRGEHVDPEAFLAAHPDVAEELREFLANSQAVRQEFLPAREAAVDVPPETQPELRPGPAPGRIPEPAPAAQLPPRIGRYRVDRLLGQGGFGVVYLARDDQLQRHVAIKVPHGEVTSQPTEAEAYLAEARLLACLDHPHVVPVHDVGSTAEFPCFIVSKYNSLGAVLYELLTVRRTFTADTRAELLELIATREPKPPRQIDDRIPNELERICLKALSRRAGDRYTTAQDLAENLRHFASQQAAGPAATPALADTTPQPGADSKTPRGDAATPASDSRPIRIVPKGLRSFDEHDADFFLELLPGPRDRDGLPDSLRFWKSRFEETDADQTFSVGLLYGPSGCGKSSLIKAGLLPRLSHDVIAVYVESTAQETESRLLNGLRKQCRGLPRDLDLQQTLIALRRGQGIASGKKVVIVLDQFEQWLHGRTGEEDGTLIQALRQCDGGQVQCLVMVRDDFWMAATRFMRELEIRLVEGHNSAAVDLFPVRHAERVLAAFGRAFGALSEKPTDTTADQQQFLQQAVAGLAEEGKVVSVRLALFAEMLKGRPWVPSELKQVGGTEGVGVTFLEATFSASTSPPEHRLHQKAAREVLKALLPESGTTIRGHLRSYEDLLEASGYTGRPRDFDQLLKILDSGLRLITPTDPEGLDGGEETGATVSTGQELTPSPRYSGERVGVRGGATDADVVLRPLPTRQRHYQLTHDYPGAIAAGLVDAQTEGNTPGPRRVAVG